MGMHLTFGRQVFAAVLELDEFLKEEEEERRQKEKKVSRPILQNTQTKKYTKIQKKHTDKKDTQRKKTHRQKTNRQVKKGRKKRRSFGKMFAKHIPI